jgi:DNA (cytosine-5)-methyltransferase 1
VDDGLPRKLDGATYRGKRTDTISPAQWRKDSLKAYGNAIVPQVAMEIFRAIKETLIISRLPRRG